MTVLVGFVVGLAPTGTLVVVGAVVGNGGGGAVVGTGLTVVTGGGGVTVLGGVGTGYPLGTPSILVQKASVELGRTGVQYM